MSHKLVASLLVLFSFIIFSCKKIIVETVPVMQYVDISIPKAGDIKHFSFPSTAVGYAASDTNFIYKTIDGGKTWNVINNTDWPSYLSCKGIVFFDELKGFCMIGPKGYSTKDGGANWTVSSPWYGGYNDEAFCGMTSSGIGIIGREENFGKIVIYESMDKGQTFSNTYNDIRITGDYKRGRVSGDWITVFTSFDNDVYGMAYSTSQAIGWDISGIGDLNEFLYTGSNAYGVGVHGYFWEDYGTYASPYRPIDSYDYYSIDSKNGLAIAVGDNTILTNMDINSEEAWNNVFDIHENGFTQKFLRIRFSGDREFYISGEKGLIWKATI